MKEENAEPRKKDGAGCPTPNAERPCPLCGKPMTEEAKWKGLWRCPDNNIRLNDAPPPFRFKCNGMEITDEGVEAFDREYFRLICERN